MEDDKLNNIIKKLDSKFTMDDDKVLEKISKFRIRLSRVFKDDFILEKVRTIIDNAKFIKFADDRARRFLDIHSSIRLKVKLNEESFQMFPNNKLEHLIKSSKVIIIDDETSEGKKNLDLFLKQKLDILHDQLIDPLLTEMFEYIMKLEVPQIKEEINDIFENMPKNSDLKRFLIPNMFRVITTANPATIDQIQIEYIF